MVRRECIDVKFFLTQPLQCTFDEIKNKKYIDVFVVIVTVYSQLKVHVLKAKFLILGISKKKSFISKSMYL